MRKLIMWNIITLDGFFEGEQPWDLSFHNIIWGDELEKISIEQLQNADYLVFGRSTYEGMAGYWPQETGEIADLMNTIPKLVASRSLGDVEWQNSTLLDDDIAAELRRLKSSPGKDLYVFGSADLSETLIEENLFDEYRIGISPVILGKGRPLFGNVSLPRHLRLTATQPLQTGGVVLRYTP